MNKILKLVQKEDQEIDLKPYEDSIGRIISVGAAIGGVIFVVLLAIQHVFDGIITF
jgi:hypothetical protein